MEQLRTHLVVLRHSRKLCCIQDITIIIQVVVSDVQLIVHARFLLVFDTVHGCCDDGWPTSCPERLLYLEIAPRLTYRWGPLMHHQTFITIVWSNTHLKAWNTKGQLFSNALHICRQCTV